jgi:RNA polymerase-binding transcription factor DksA
MVNVAVEATALSPWGGELEGLGEDLRGLRHSLYRERLFRIEQLVKLSGELHSDASESDGVVQEVHRAILDGTQRVLREIDGALEDMGRAGMSICQSCATRIPRSVLQVVPEPGSACTAISRKESRRYQLRKRRRLVAGRAR